MRTTSSNFYLSLTAIIEERLKRSTRYDSQILPRVNFSTLCGRLLASVEYTLDFKQPRNETVEEQRGHFEHCFRSFVPRELNIQNVRSCNIFYLSWCVDSATWGRVFPNRPS